MVKKAKATKVIKAKAKAGAKSRAKPKRRPRPSPVFPGGPTEADEAMDRDDLYSKAARQSIRSGESDKLVRHLMAAGLAAGDGLGEVLAQDLVLLRWVLKKMESNRKVYAVSNSFAAAYAETLGMEEEYGED